MNISCWRVIMVLWLHDLYAFFAASNAVFNSSLVVSGTLLNRIISMNNHKSSRLTFIKHFLITYPYLTPSYIHSYPYLHTNLLRFPFFLLALGDIDSLARASRHILKSFKSISFSFLQWESLSYSHTIHNLSIKVHIHLNIMTKTNNIMSLFIFFFLTTYIAHCYVIIKHPNSSNLTR